MKIEFRRLAPAYPGARSNYVALFGIAILARITYQYCPQERLTTSWGVAFGNEAEPREWYDTLAEAKANVAMWTQDTLLDPGGCPCLHGREDEFAPATH